MHCRFVIRSLVIIMASPGLISTKLDMLDKLTIGKFAGFRICDIIADDFEYLIWLPFDFPRLQYVAKNA